MKTAEIIRDLGIVLACIAVATATTSCDKGRRTSNTASDVQIEAAKTPSRDEVYTAEFQRLVISSNMSVVATSRGVDNVCTELAKLPKEEALPLLDKFIDMAIAQSVTETNYCYRQVWFEQLFHVVMGAFIVSQRMRKESFEHWDKLFLFFKKYTDEITKVEKSMPPPAPDNIGTRWGLKRGDYLLKVKGDLKQWVHVMRRFYFPKLSEGLTDEQKADILRRFEEVEKFAAYPPDSPCGGNERGKK